MNDIDDSSIPDQTLERCRITSESGEFQSLSRIMGGTHNIPNRPGLSTVCHGSTFKIINSWRLTSFLFCIPVHHNWSYKRYCICGQSTGRNGIQESPGGQIYSLFARFRGLCTTKTGLPTIGDYPPLDSPVPGSGLAPTEVLITVLTMNIHHGT